MLFWCLAPPLRFYYWLFNFSLPQIQFDVFFQICYNTFYISHFIQILKLAFYFLKRVNIALLLCVITILETYVVLFLFFLSFSLFSLLFLVHDALHYCALGYFRRIHLLKNLKTLRTKRCSSQEGLALLLRTLSLWECLNSIHSLRILETISGWDANPQVMFFTFLCPLCSTQNGERLPFSPQMVVW